MWTEAGACLSFFFLHFFTITAQKNKNITMSRTDDHVTQQDYDGFKHNKRKNLLLKSSIYCI